MIVTLQQRVDRLAAGHFTGGRPDRFVTSGRQMLIMALSAGLTPDSVVCDVGCGSLRGGYWLINVLQPGCYHGIEPRADAVTAGLEHVIDPETVDVKRPRFDHNDRFGLAVFDVTFDMVIAKAVWTHAAKTQIEALLDSFVACSHAGSVLLADYWPATHRRPDHRGDEWVGRSHHRDEPGWVGHDRDWVASACRSRGLGVADVGKDPTDNHEWLVITR